MTYEEFQYGALNPPKPVGPSIFKLTKIVADTHLRRIGLKRYPKYDVRIEYEFFFFNLEEAKKKLQILVAESKENNNQVTYCYYIEEFPICAGEYSEENGDRLVSWRVYDGDGNLLDYSRCSELNCHWGTIYGRYLGRPDEDIHFHEGDIVEVLDICECEVKLYVVMSENTNIDWRWRFFNHVEEWYHGQNQKDITDEDRWKVYFADYSDDQYALCDGPNYMVYHEHVNSRFIFKPHFFIPQRTLDKYRKMYNKIISSK